MCSLIVSFANGSEHAFSVSNDQLAQTSLRDARLWFDQEFTALECTPGNPVGKILIVDQILNVAKYAGEARFSGQDPWPRLFATHALKCIGRTHLRVDTEGFALSY